MAFLQAFRATLKKWSAYTPAGLARDEQGIALFMVLAAVAVLTLLISEFAYIASISQNIAYGNLDQAKAHYLAKSGLKLSLLRLKAYQKVKDLSGGLGGAAGGGGLVPKAMIEKIWSFPFMYPLPTQIPGLSKTDQEMIQKFQKNSQLEGSFTAVIESESGKLNLNSIIPGIGPAAASPSPQPSATPSASPTPFDPSQARQSLELFFQNLIHQKSESDSDFASQYRDLRFSELMDQLISWADRTYQRQTPADRDLIPPKRAPFYSVSELHNLSLMDDDIYDLFAPNLTALPTQGVNINTMNESTLRALIPLMNKDELRDFFKYRDSPTEGSLFNKVDDFYKYLTTNVAAYKSNSQGLQKLQQDFSTRGIQLLTDESLFKITVQAKVNSSTRTIEAWVSVKPVSAAQQVPQPSAGVNPTTPQPSGATTTGQTQQQAAPPDSGLKITYMRIY